MIFTYWANKIEWHEKLLTEIEAETISEADKIFEQQTGLNPIKNVWIGCQITKSQVVGFDNCNPQIKD